MTLEDRIQAYYNAVSQDIRDDIVEALEWARKTLTNHEGSGHIFAITGAKNSQVCCSFAKPQWAGDHCSRPMESGSEAVVMAVSEYLNGA